MENQTLSPKVSCDFKIKEKYSKKDTSFFENFNDTFITVRCGLFQVSLSGEDVLYILIYISNGYEK